MGRPRTCLINAKGRECTNCACFLPWSAYNKATTTNAPYMHQSMCRECRKEKDKRRVAQRQAEKGITSEGRRCEQCSTYKLWEDFPLRKNPSNNMPPRLCSLCRKENADRSAVNYKVENWHRWKANSLRTSWLARVRKDPARTKEDLPSRDDVEAWLLKQEPFTCYFTGVLLDKHTMQVDHLTPVSRGGEYALQNLAVCTKEMNQLKGEMLENDFKSLLGLIATWSDQGAALIKLVKRAAAIWGKKRR